MATRKKQPLKTLHLLKTSTGAAWALRQMSELVKLGMEVHVALPAGGALIARYQDAGVRVHLLNTDFPIRKIWRFSRIAADLRALVRQLEPNIIHSHFVGTTLSMRLALGKKHPIPRVFQVAGPLHLEHLLFRRGELAAAGPRDYWIGSCQWTCERYRKSGIRPGHIFLSYYGMDIDAFSASQRPGKLRGELGVTDETPLIGMVAFMYAPKPYLFQRRGLKGHEDLIDALAICRQTAPNIKGVFIGGAWNHATGYEQQVRDYARKRLGDAAVFLGSRSDVAELYPDLTLAVHPSHSENVGGACESLLLRIPTIATNVGGLPDVVIPEKTGWLTPPRNPSRLAATILEALRDPIKAKKLALEGQSLVKNLLDVKKNAREIYDSYRAILK